MAPLYRLAVSLILSILFSSTVAMAQRTPIDGGDGFNMVPVVSGARFVNDFYWGSLRKIAYQGRRFVEIKLEVGFERPPASPPCEDTDRHVQIVQEGFRLNTVGTPTQPVTQPVGFSWIDPPEFSDGYALATAKFTVDLAQAHGLASLTVIVPASAYVQGQCRDSEGGLSYYTTNFSTVMQAVVVLWPDYSVELVPYDSDRIVQVQVKQLTVTPSVEMTPYGVTVVTKPAVGERVTLKSKSGSFVFAPEEGVTWDYQGAMGLALFSYSASPSIFGAQSSIKEDVEATIGRENGWGTAVWLHYAQIDSVENDVSVKYPLTGNFVSASRGDKLPPGTVIQLRNSLDQDGAIRPPALTLSFYDGARAQAELPRPYVYDPDQGPVYLELGESGVTQSATADFVTDGTNLARTVAAEPREYAKVAVYEGLSKGVGSALFGGFGFVAKSAAEKITRWGVEKLGDWAGSTPQSRSTRQGDASSAVSPVGGSQESAYVVGTFLADGSLVISNRGAAVKVSNVAESTSAVLPGSSEVSVSGTTGTLSAPSSLLVPDPMTTVPITITPADGSTVPTLRPCILLEYPNDAVVTRPLVDLSSLTLRVNGYLVSPEMFPGAYSTTFGGTILKSTWCAPASRPFREGANTLKAGISTFGGQRATASATVTAQWSAPDAPQNLMAYAGHSRVLLAWDESSEPSVVGYRIYRGTTQIGQSALSRWLVSVEDSLSGELSVTAVDAANRESGASATVPAELSTSRSLPAPTKPLALDATPGDSRVNLHVEADAAGSLAWRFERATGAGGEFSVIASLTGADYVDDAVTVGTPYWYRAIPIGYDGAEGEGVEAGPVTVVNAAPGRPTGVTGEMSGTGVLIEWNPSPEADLGGYRVYRKTYGAADWELQGPGLLQSTSFLTTVQHATLYAWAVTAVDSSGLEGPESAAVTGGEFGVTPLSVTAVTPASGTALGGTPITITGTGFLGSTTVTIGGVGASIMSVSATSIAAVTPWHGAGFADVVVANPDGQQVIVPAGFRFLASVAPVDLGGAGRSDAVVFRGSAGGWWIHGQSGSVAFGQAGDIPVVADYDGDGHADLAVYRPATSEWIIKDQRTAVIGQAGDVPVPADYNGDGRAEIAVFRPTTGEWLLEGLPMTIRWGMRGDVPVPADYDGDGLAEFAVFRPTTGVWYIEGGETLEWGMWGDVPVAGDYNGDGKAEMAVYRPSTGWWYVARGAMAYWGAPGDRPVPLDLDGDGVTEFVVYRPGDSTWYALNPVTQVTSSVAWGQAGDEPVGLAPHLPATPVLKTAGDFDRDGAADITVFRPSAGGWYTLESTHAYRTVAGATLGQAGDVPVPGDYQGTGHQERAVYRPSTGQWLLEDGRSVTLGAPGDVPVPRDYDGDGVMDIAVFTPGTGLWSILTGASGFTTLVTQVWGASGDVPAPGDYDGDGRTDFAVFTPATGQWTVRSSMTGTTLITVPFGMSGDIPVPGDYEGDGKADIAVYRPGTGTWYVLASVTGWSDYQGCWWGAAGDVPVPGDFDGDGRTDIAVYRPTTGAWYVMEVLTIIGWGEAGDVPILGRQ